MSRIIKGDKIIFKNQHSDKDITLAHNATGYDLIFDSECVFQLTTEHKSLKLGEFTIELSNDSAGLEVKKNDQTLFKFTD